MLEIEVELPQETKTIEWSKTHPTFHELKERLRQCGITAGKNCCVEVDRAGEFLTPDDNDLVDGPLIRVRASQILCSKTPWKRSKLNQPPMKDAPSTEQARIAYHNRSEELLIEGVIPFVGRIFVLPKKLQDITLDDCTSTVGLVGSNGESIGAFHLIKKAWKRPRRYDLYIKYANHVCQPCFPAKLLAFNDELGIFIAAPASPFEFSFPKFLTPASGIAVGDAVHCMGFPKLIAEEAISQVKNLNETRNRVEFPSVFSGNVCFSGWKQALADYRVFPKSSGAVLVDDEGRLKGIHVASLSGAEYIPEALPEVAEVKSRGSSIEKRTRALYDHVNKCLPQVMSGVKRSAEAAVFVPVNVLMQTLTPSLDATCNKGYSLFLREKVSVPEAKNSMSIEP